MSYVMGLKCNTADCHEVFLYGGSEGILGVHEEAAAAGWVVVEGNGSVVHTCPRCVSAPPLLRDLYGAGQHLKDCLAPLEDMGFVVTECDSSLGHENGYEGCRFHVRYDSGITGSDVHARVLVFLDEWSVNVIEDGKTRLGPNNEPV